MKDFKKTNNIVGWVLFAIATLVYTLTVEPTASFWDCGEFIAVSYKLMVPHPPGAPLYLLIGRLFSMFAFGDVLNVAFAINMLSVLSSAFTILFLYWSIVLLGKKLLKADEQGNYSIGQQYALVGAGIIGSLAYTFSDSFWFSAVEAEVYAMSSFFTAFVFWGMLKWELIEDEKEQNRWMILLFYTMGLSIGVHLLNLVTIPALALIYYFKKYPQPNLKGIAITLFTGLVVLGIINSFIIPTLPTIAGMFEIHFVNGWGMPFGFGIVVFILLFIGALVYGIIYSQQKGKEVLNLSLLCFAFVLIGYASYGIVVIRSNFDTPIDENNPEDIIRFVKYLKREQYGDRPLLKGPVFDTQRTGVERGAAKYRKAENGYEIYDYKQIPKYDEKRMMLLPRMYSTQGGHPDLYRKWAGMKPNQKPTFADNIKFMFRFQFGHIYYRYFMWNFAGRAGDDKDSSFMMPWESESKGIPEDIAQSKARDNFYCLPLLLGLIGLVFQFFRDKNSFFVTVLLFFLTGLALVIYLNSPPVEPRERDYIYVGSFYVFAIWIGFGVLSIYDKLSSLIKSETVRPVAATAICLIVPVIMGAKGWDNHNRSGRYHSVDQARNTLASCAPNAILFTGGDNDTFPLWYVQEVEGFRTDVRVVVLSYFSTDWYIEQMKRKVYESEALPIEMDITNYLEGTNDYLPLGRSVSDQAVNVKPYIKLVNERNPKVLAQFQDGSQNAVLLSKQFYLNIDKQDLIAKRFVPKDKENRIVDRMVWNVKGGYIFKSDLAILDILAHFNWERPVYFNNTSANTANLDLRQYLQQEGLIYRLMPIQAASAGGEVGEINIEVMKENIKKFAFRGFDNETIYHDEEYKKFGSNTRNAYFRLALELFNKGRKEEAVEILDEALANIPDKSIPYSYFIPRFVELYYLLGETEKAKEISDLIGKRAEETLAYLMNHHSYGYEIVKQKSMLVVNQLAYIYRRAEENTSNRIKRQEMINQVREQGSDSAQLGGLEEEGNLEELKKEKELYAQEFKRYNDLFSTYSPVFR